MRDNTGARSVVANSDMHTAPQALSDQPATSSSSVKKQQYNGLLHRLSTACRLATRRIAKTGPVAHVYDNINWIMKIAEQILGRSQAQENGTCATIFPLFDAKREDMTTKALLESIDTAPPLLLDDIVLTPDEQAFHRKCTIHTILRILISQGGEHFVRFKKDLENCRPDSDTKIPLHKTDVYPLPAMNINESSIIGNAEVMEAIFEELEQPITEPEFMDEVRIVCGDQLSVTNLRSVTTNRAGDDEPTQTFANVVTIPGLFHAQIHILSGILEKHWGSAEGPQDPGSLHLHNTLLARKPIVLSSLPPYRTCRDLVFVSLYARVFHCLELVAGYNSLEEYTESVTFDQLYEHATEIVDRFATAQVATKLRASRARELRKPEPERTAAGDVVFENAVLFMRDALLVREFTDAIKGGDSGRVIICLKIFAMAYRGCGKTKYAYEMLHVIHKFKYIWPKPLR